MNNIDESSSAIYFYCGKVKYEYWINVVYFGGQVMKYYMYVMK